MAAWLAAPAHAQVLRAPPGALGAPTPAPAAPVTRAADHIVVVVNSEPITASEVRARQVRVEQRLAQQGGNMPSRAELEREVLELLIVERVQLQRARDLNIKVEDSVLDQAELSIAQQNGLDTPEALRERLRQQGMDPARFRDELRNDILLQRLREREVETPLRVSDRDIDDYLLEQRSAASSTPTQINLGHVLVRLPENASNEVVAERLARAMRVVDRAKAGGDFAALAREFSDGPEAASGGAMGLRTPDRYPQLFIDATQALPVGDVTGPLRSGAGFHVLKVLDKQRPAGPDAPVTQTRARHILLRTSPQLSQAAAIAQLRDWRQQVVSGKADFAALAKANSQDGSAREGGDLGWASPGMFVPEFENTMNALQANEVSEPVVSRFGVHLIQVLERRQKTLTATELRNSVRSEVRERKLDQAYTAWARELRDRAYVEFRQPRN